MENTEIKKYVFVLFSGLFGVEAYGMSIGIMLFMVYALLCGIDIFLGIARARANMQAGSRPMGVGMNSKVTQGLVALIWMIMCWHATYVAQSDIVDWTISIIGVLPMAGFCVVQLYSIVENWNLVATNAMEKRFLSILNKIMGIGMDKLEEKADRFTTKPQ